MFPVVKKDRRRICSRSACAGFLVLQGTFRVQVHLTGMQEYDSSKF
jgi:hypothetical protein